MKRRYTERFNRSFQRVSPRIQKAFDKQAALLLQDLRHPSLRAKKFDESSDLWQARVTGSWRMYFMIENDTYVFLDIIPHPK
jgi:mRNA-degrading endonuclease RelE of RelBE toxin-antitoxin system